MKYAISISPPENAIDYGYNSYWRLSAPKLEKYPFEPGSQSSYVLSSYVLSSYVLMHTSSPGTDGLGAYTYREPTNPSNRWNFQFNTESDREEEGLSNLGYPLIRCRQERK